MYEEDIDSIFVMAFSAHHSACTGDWQVGERVESVICFRYAD